MTPIAHATFSMERTFAHRPSRVYRAWTDATQRPLWFRPPEGWSQRYSGDLREGGGEDNDSVTPDGQVHRYLSRILQLRAPERVVYTFEMFSNGVLHSVSAASVELHEHPQGCRMVYTEHCMFLDDTVSVEQRREGTAGLLDQLAGLLARELTTERYVAASPAAVWSTVANPERLPRWWGPAGFTNSVETCDLTLGGDWVFTMHAPDGAAYPNRARFTAVEPERRLQVTHLNGHVFTLDIGLEPEGSGTRVTWVQRFESAGVRDALLPLIGNKNEENLDRLVATIG